MLTIFLLVICVCLPSGIHAKHVGFCPERSVTRGVPKITISADESKLPPICLPRHGNRTRLRTVRIELSSAVNIGNVMRVPFTTTQGTLEVFLLQPRAGTHRMVVWDLLGFRFPFDIIVVPGAPHSMFVVNAVDAWFSCLGILPTQPVLSLLDRSRNVILNPHGALTARAVGATITGELKVFFISGKAEFRDLYICSSAGTQVRLRFDYSGASVVSPAILDLVQADCPDTGNITASLSPVEFAIHGTDTLVTVTGRAFPHQARRRFACVWANRFFSAVYVDCCHVVCRMDGIRLPHSGQLVIALGTSIIGGGAWLTSVGPLFRILISSYYKTTTSLPFLPNTQIGLPPIEVRLVDDSNASFQGGQMIPQAVHIQLSVGNTSVLNVTLRHYHTVVTGLIAMLSSPIPQTLSVTASDTSGQLTPSVMQFRFSPCASICPSSGSPVPLVCGGHGVCVSSFCECYTHWRGHDCTKQCPGGTHDGGVCSGHGECSDDGVCRCSDGYFTATCHIECTIEKCQNTHAMLRPRCDDKGSCVCQDDDGGHYRGAQCNVCADHWWGPFCGFSCMCSGNGMCDETTGVCSCHSDHRRGHWAPPACADCLPGHMGPQCTTPVSPITRSYSMALARFAFLPEPGPWAHAFDDDHRMVYYGSSPPLRLNTTTNARSVIPMPREWNGTVIRGIHILDSQVLVVGELRGALKMGVFRRDDEYDELTDVAAPLTTPVRKLLQLTQHATFGNLIASVVVSGTTFAFYSKGYVIPFQSNPFLQLVTSTVLVPEKWKTVSGVVESPPYHFAFGAGIANNWMLVRFILTASAINNMTNFTALFSIRHCSILTCSSIERCSTVTGTTLACVLLRSDGAVAMTFLSNGTSVESGIVASSTAFISVGPMAIDNATLQIYFALSFDTAPTTIYKFTLSTMATTGTYSFTQNELVTALSADATQRRLTATVTLPSLVRNDVLNMFNIDTVTPDVIDSRGGAFVRVTGEGFGSLGSLACLFGSQEVSAISSDSNSMTCLAPKSVRNTGEDACSTETFSVKLGASARSATLFVRRPATPVLVSLLTDGNEVFTAVGRDTIVTVSGFGFVNSPYLRCRFESPSFPTIIATRLLGHVSFVSASVVVCQHEKITIISQAPTTISVSLDGFVFSNLLPYAVVGAPMGVEMSSPDPSAEIEIASDAFTVLPLVQLHIRDVNFNRVGKFDTGPHIFVVKDVTVHKFIPSILGSAVTVDGSLSMKITIARPFAGRAKISIDIVEMYTLWTVNLKIRITVGRPIKIVPNMTKTELGSWVFASQKEESLKPNPRFTIVDPGDNLVTDTAVLPEFMYLKYIRVVLGQIGLTKDANELSILRAKSSDGIYGFGPVPTLGFHGQIYTLTFEVDQKYGIPSYVTDPIPIANCSQYEYAIVNTLICQKCPPFGICTGNAVVTPMENYWRPSPKSFTFYSCEPPFSDNSCSKGTCRTGYRGARCSSCIRGYGMAGLKCSKCSVPLFDIMQIIGFILLVVLFLGILIGSTLASSGKPKDQLPILIKMLTSHLQICGQIGDFATALPQLLSSFFHAMKNFSTVATSNFAAIDCVTDLTYFDRYIILMMSPFIICAGILLVLFCNEVYRFFVDYGLRHQNVENSNGEKELSKDEVVERREVILEIKGGWEKNETLTGKKRFRQIVRNYIAGRREKAKHGNFADLANYVRLRGYMNAIERKENLKIFLLSVVIVFFFMYPTLIEQCAAVLYCEEIDFGVGEKRFVLAAERSIDCFTREHVYYTRFAVGFGVFYALGMPLAVLGGIKLVAWIVNDMDIAKILFFFLTAGFKDETWYWETVILLRKALMIFITVFVRNGLLQTYLAMWLMICTVGLNSAFLPYKNKLLSKLEVTSIATITVTLNFGLIFRFLQPSDWRYSVIVIILLVLNGLIVFLFVIFIFKAMAAKIRDIALDFNDWSKPFFKKHHILAFLIDYEVEQEYVTDSDSDGEYENEAERNEHHRVRTEKKMEEFKRKLHRKQKWTMTNLMAILGFDENEDNVSREEEQRREMNKLKRMRRTEGGVFRVLNPLQQKRLEYESMKLTQSEMLREREGVTSELQYAQEDLAELKDVAVAAYRYLEEVRRARLELEKRWASKPIRSFVREETPPQYEIPIQAKGAAPGGETKADSVSIVSETTDAGAGAADPETQRTVMNDHLRGRREKHGGQDAPPAEDRRIRMSDFAFMLEQSEGTPDGTDLQEDGRPPSKDRLPSRRTDTSQSQRTLKTVIKGVIAAKRMARAGTNRELKVLRAMFDKIDSDKAGTLNFKKLAYVANSARCELTQDNAKAAMKALACTADISFEMFTAWYLSDAANDGVWMTAIRAMMVKAMPRDTAPAVAKPEMPREGQKTTPAGPNEGQKTIADALVSRESSGVLMMNGEVQNEGQKTIAAPNMPPIGHTPPNKNPIDLKALRDTFDKLDKNKAGTLDVKKIAKMAKSAGCEMSQDNAKAAMASLDPDGEWRSTDGVANPVITFEKFTEWFSTDAANDGVWMTALRAMMMKAMPNKNPIELEEERGRENIIDGFSQFFIVLVVADESMLRFRLLQSNNGERKAILQQLTSAS